MADNWSWQDFKSGMVYTIPFSHGSHTTDLLTTGKTDYWLLDPESPFGENSDFTAGVAAGYFLQKTLFGAIPFASMAFIEWRIQAWLFKQVWPAYFLYESARANYWLAEQIQEDLGATEADMVKSSWMLKWAKAGDVGAGGVMPVVPSFPTDQEIEEVSDWFSSVSLPFWFPR